jgi:hypothetical protein
MCAMDAVSHGADLEKSRGSTVGNEVGDVTKAWLLGRAAFRITCLLVLVLRNTSSSATPVDLTQAASRVAISRLVADDDRLTPELHPRLAWGVSVRKRIAALDDVRRMQKRPFSDQAERRLR